MNNIRVQLVRDASVRYSEPMKSSKDVFELVTDARNSDREQFLSLLVDTKNRVIGIETVAIGTTTAALVSPKEVFKSAILANATGIILVHNHPSGDTTPSVEDSAITAKLRKAGQLLDIPVIDHVVVTQVSYFSYIDSGLMATLN
jgi:DNA repair protein RadC